MTPHSSYIDPLLLVSIAEGNENDFKELLKIIVPGLAALVQKIVKSEDSVKEIMQESFVRIWINRDKLPELEKPYPWLKRVVLNETFTWLTKNARRAEIFTTYFDSLPSKDNSTQENLAARETEALLHQAIEKLPAQRKKIYMMSRVQGMTITEIAEELDVSTGYVKNAISAALDSIREFLVQAGRIGLLFLLFGDL